MQTKERINSGKSNIRRTRVNVKSCLPVQCTVTNLAEVQQINNVDAGEQRRSVKSCVVVEDSAEMS
jgi:hypothetical protein